MHLSLLGRERDEWVVILTDCSCPEVEICVAVFCPRGEFLPAYHKEGRLSIEYVGRG